MEWNNPFSTINSAFAKISLFAWWPFTIPRWSLRENWMWENSFVATISMVLLNLCAKKKEGFRFFLYLSSWCAIDTIFTNNESDSLSNFWYLIWSFGPAVLNFFSCKGVNNHSNFIVLLSTLAVETTYWFQYFVVII